MTTTIIRESRSSFGHQIITVVEFTSSKVVMLVNDCRNTIQEEIVLKNYIDAYEVYYDFDRGWMAGGNEIPYLDSF